MNRAIMRTDDSDNESTENTEINLSKQFSKFIRLKGIDKFCQAMRTNNCASSNCKQHKLRSCKDANNNELSDQESDMDQDTSSSRSNCDSEMARMDETEGSGDEIDARIRTEYGSPFEWFKVWREISASLDSIKFNNENMICLENYTLLLKIHVNHRFTLDMNCYRSLLHCIRPDLIEKIFDMNLIDKDDAFHIGCLIESDDLFTGIDILADSIETINKYTPKILYSLSVLIYKDKECLNHANKIVNSMNAELAVFINREERDERRARSPIYTSLKQAVRHFLLACALNGIFNEQRRLDSFLSNKETESTDDSLSDSSMSDLISDSDSDSSSPNEALERIIQDVHRLRRVENQLRVDLPYNPRSPPPPNNNGNNNGNNNNNNNNLNIKSVEDRMNLNGIEFKKLLYPMSLKNLCRIAIKTSMDPYDLNSVNKLTILPNVLKRFMLFQDEIDDIIKLAQN